MDMVFAFWGRLSFMYCAITSCRKQLSTDFEQHCLLQPGFQGRHGFQGHLEIRANRNSIQRLVHKTSLFLFFCLPCEILSYTFIVFQTFTHISRRTFENCDCNQMPTQCSAKFSLEADS